MNRALTDARNQGLVAKKADVVGHSMGGILARKYGDSSYIRKLVTVGTPHFGSPWADFLVAHPMLEIVLNVFGNSMRNGAISDLKTKKCHVLANGMNVPTLAIAGISDPFVFPGAGGDVFHALFGLSAIGIFTPSIVHTSLFGTDTTSDWVVSTTSQGGCIPITPVYGIWHLEEPGNSEVSSIIVDFLNSSTVQAVVQCEELETPVRHSEIEPQSSQDIAQSEEIGEEITIAAPSPGTMYAPGDTVQVSVIAPPETTTVWMATPGSPAAIVESAPFTANITIPQEAIGQTGIAVVAFAGEDLLAVASTVVSVSTNAFVTSFKVFPESTLYLRVGEKVNFVVLGSFSDGVDRDITSSQNGTAYESTDPAVAFIGVNGLLTAKAPGFCLVTVQNDFYRKSIPVFVQSSTLNPDSKSMPWLSLLLDF